MRNPPRDDSRTTSRDDPRTAPRGLDGRTPRRWVLGGIALLFGLGLGYLLGTDVLEGEARDPLEVVRQMEPAGLTCTLVVRVDRGGGEQAAVCLSTDNEVLTIGTFADRPDPDTWAAELCRDGFDGVVPIRGALVVFDQTLVTVVAGPLPSEAGGSVPDPAGLAESIATTLDGEWQRYQC